MIARTLMLVVALATTMALAGFNARAADDSGSVGTEIEVVEMVYHSGQVMQDSLNVYLIWYGGWRSGTPANNLETQAILSDFIVGLGSSRYMKINTLYPDALGNRPSGAVFYGGSLDDDSYSQGTALTPEMMQTIVSRHLEEGNFPVDPHGIYVVIGTPDISDLRADSSSFCTGFSPPYHGRFSIFGSQIKFAFIGHAARCPEAAAPHFIAEDGSALATPNGNFAADAMASTMAHAFNTVITNPMGSGWMDKYGLENADKCLGTFGETYVMANGANANMKLGERDFLVQQNWVNTQRGFCALAIP